MGKLGMKLKIHEASIHPGSGHNFIIIGFFFETGSLIVALNLQKLQIVPHVFVTPKHKIILLPLQNCTFATVMNCNINI